MYQASSSRRDTTLAFVAAGLLLTSVVGIGVLPRDPLKAVPLLFCIWGLCVCVFVLVLVSYQLGQAAIAMHLRQTGRYYLSEEPLNLRSVNLFSVTGHLLGYVSSVVAIAASVCLIVFLSVNVARPTSNEPGAAVEYELSTPEDSLPDSKDQ